MTATTDRAKAGAAPVLRPITVRQIVLPQAARALCTLGRIDYADAFLVDRAAAPDRTAEQWARTILEHAPLMRRISLLWGWTALGLRLRAPWSTRFVLGWEVRHSTPDVALFGVGSRFGLAAELLFERQPGTLLFATFVQQTNPVARAVWPAVIPIHQQVVQSLLEQASRGQRRREQP